MTKLFNSKCIQHPTNDLHQKDIFAIVLEQMRDRINDEIEDPNGQFTANDLGRLQREMYG